MDINIFLILKSYISRFVSLSFWKFCQQQQLFVRYALNTFLYNFPTTMISMICGKSLLLSIHILLGLQLDSSRTSWEALVIVIPFLFFKGATHAYLLKALITHNKNRNPFLYLLINYTSARSAPQILSLKDESTFSFSIFLMIGCVIL